MEVKSENEEEIEVKVVKDEEIEMKIKKTEIKTESFGLDFDDDLDETLTQAWDTELEKKVHRDIDIADKENPQACHLEELQKYFRHNQFHHLQWKIISSLMHDKKDVVAIMATGYGKSLCFQFPPVYLDGVSIVISPLISLMEDQVFNLKLQNIPAVLLGSAQRKKQLAYKDIYNNKYRIVYLTPEFCCGERGIEVLTTMRETLKIVLIAIDEAHCISGWGHDFRYQYKQLHIMRHHFPNVPILAMTATATPKVRDEIVASLMLKNPRFFCAGFDRPNLYLGVRHRGWSIMTDLKSVGCLDENNRFSGPTIIYCITRQRTEELAIILCANGLKALPYHAGMGLKIRKENHENFVNDEIDVIVATIAFGMGIDKPDVRNVIHYGCSSSLEAYYQEVGRAGRDGDPSNCWTFYDEGDWELYEYMWARLSAQSRSRRKCLLQIMINYLKTHCCRRQFILNYFEGKKLLEEKKKEFKTDCCSNCDKGSFRVLAPSIQKIKVEKVEKKPRNKRTKKQIEEVIVIDENDDNHGLSSSVTVDITQNVEPQIPRKKSKRLSQKYDASQYDTSSEDELLPTMPAPKVTIYPGQDLFKLLVERRKELASHFDCRDSTIISIAALKQISIEKPTDADDLLEIRGFTAPKVEKYGQDFIYIVKEYLKTHSK